MLSIQHNYFLDLLSNCLLEPPTYIPQSNFLLNYKVRTKGTTTADHAVNMVVIKLLKKLPDIVFCKYVLYVIYVFKIRHPGLFSGVRMEVHLNWEIVIDILLLETRITCNLLNYGFDA